MPQAKTQRGEPPRFEELLARAEVLIPVLRERAPRAEQLRRLPDETIADLHASGLFRMLQPARVGGSELPYRALFELTAVIGQGCGSTAWVLANLAAHHWLLGMWPPEAQDEIFAGGDFRCASVAAPVGRAERAGDGWEINGQVAFASGSPYSTFYTAAPGGGHRPGRGVAGHVRSLARRAPSDSEDSLAQQMSGSIAPNPDHVPKPQSLPPITRSAPTIRA